MAGKKKTTRKKSAGKKKKSSGEVTMTKVKAVVTAAIKPIKKDLDGLKTRVSAVEKRAGISGKKRKQSSGKNKSKLRVAHRRKAA